MNGERRGESAPAFSFPGPDFKGFPSILCLRASAPETLARDSRRVGRPHPGPPGREVSPSLPIPTHGLSEKFSPLDRVESLRLYTATPCRRPISCRNLTEGLMAQKPKKATKPAGGAATTAGAVFQENVAAYFAVLILAEAGAQPPTALPAGVHLTSLPLANGT